MVRNISNYLVRLYSRFQPRTSPLSEDARKKRTALVILMLGILLGMWAYKTSSSEARITWLKHHSPSEAFWWKTLKERGYVQITDSDWWEKSPAEFPFRKPSSPSIWITENRRLFLRYGNSGWEAWGLQDSSPPIPDRNLWEPLGFGWDAVDTFVQMDLPLTRTKLDTPRITRWVDPRAIQY